jgi:NAD(P)-dependent dehydrogenase (short-subunit alcohol dehydrogenase family)
MFANSQANMERIFVPSNKIIKFNNMSANKKIALVTGGSRGLGKNMALSIARKGIDVILTYNNQQEEALKVVAAIEETGQKAVALQLNTGEVSGFDSFVETLKNTLEITFKSKHFDFLVNNAGIGIGAAFAQTTEQQFDLLMNIHFKGVFFLTQKALPFISDGGSIINLSSGLSRFSSPGFSAYASMKGAVEILTKYQAKELGARGIRSNIIAPGAIETDFGGGVVRDNPNANKHIAETTALGRAGLPDDIGGVVAFLCTEEAKWINGQRIEVSGGMNL